MKIFGIGRLHSFKSIHADSCGAIDSWIKEVEDANWTNFHKIRDKYGSASNLGSAIVVFNIKGNRYRLETKVYYQKKAVLVTRIGTHAEYSKWQY